VLGEDEKRLLFLQKNCAGSKGVEHEIVAHHLRDVLEILSDLTGKNINEKMLDDVFKNFCVGK
jgi:tRNA U34 5-carboxymethylaminomethyl modifying GTPase MnmE/TrmE